MWGECVVHQVRLYSVEEEGLESVFHVTGAGRGSDKGMGWVGGLEGAGKELGGKEGEVIIDREGLGFGVKMLYGRHLHTTSSGAEGVVLDSLEFGYVGWGGVGVPNGGGVKEKGADNGFISDGDSFELLAPGRASKCSEDIEAGGGAGNKVGNMVTEGEMGVKGDPQ